MKNKRIVYIIMLTLIGLHFFFGCGTKTKSSTETENKEKVVQESEEIKKQRSIDSIKVSLEEEFRKKYAETNSEKTNTEATKTTTTEVTETIKSPTADFRHVPGTDLFLNDKNGKIIERRTKTIIEERFNQEQLKKRQIEFEETEKRKKDSIAFVEKIEEIIQNHILQYDKKQKRIEESKEKKGVQLGFWFWFWVGLILLLIIAFFLFRKWLAIQFPFLSKFKLFT